MQFFSCLHLRHDRIQPIAGFVFFIPEILCKLILTIKNPSFEESNGIITLISVTVFLSLSRTVSMKEQALHWIDFLSLLGVSLLAICFYLYCHAKMLIGISSLWDKPSHLLWKHNPLLYSLWCYHGNEFWNIFSGFPSIVWSWIFSEWWLEYLLIERCIMEI